MARPYVHQRDGVVYRTVRCVQIDKCAQTQNFSNTACHCIGNQFLPMGSELKYSSFYAFTSYSHSLLK